MSTQVGVSTLYAVKKHAKIILSKQIYLLDKINDIDYKRKFMTPLKTSSVGSHIRHSLDHFNCVIECIKQTNVSTVVQ